MNPRVQLNTLVHDLEIQNVIIIDASSNGSPAAHTELFHRGFRIISANKNPLSGENFAVASQMLSSQKYGGEATVMAGQ